MGIAGVFKRPLALDERLGLRTWTNEPKLGRRKLPHSEGVRSVFECYGRFGALTNFSGTFG